MIERLESVPSELRVVPAFDEHHMLRRAMRYSSPRCLSTAGGTGSHFGKAMLPM